MLTSHRALSLLLVGDGQSDGSDIRYWRYIVKARTFKMQRREIPGYYYGTMTGHAVLTPVQ